MDADRKARDPKSECRGQKQETAPEGRVLVNALGLAVALGVSLRTVRRMLAAEEIKPIWIRGAQRFHVPDVVESLRDQSRKWGRAAALPGNPKSDQSKSEGNPKPETRVRMAAGGVK